MGMKRIEAPMAATLLQIAVAPGQALRRGDLLLVVEAMKMEHELRAECDARVVEIAVREGEQLDAGQLLLRARAARLGSGGARLRRATRRSRRRPHRPCAPISPRCANARR